MSIKTALKRGKRWWAPYVRPGASRAEKIQGLVDSNDYWHAVAQSTLMELEQLREVERAARAYVREFDHLIGSRDKAEAAARDRRYFLLGYRPCAHCGNPMAPAQVECGGCGSRRTVAKTHEPQTGAPAHRSQREDGAS